MFFQKLKRSIAEQRAEERSRAEIEKQGALLEYVATMADINIPTENVESEGLEHGEE